MTRSLLLCLFLLALPGAAGAQTTNAANDVELGPAIFPAVRAIAAPDEQPSLVVHEDGSIGIRRFWPTGELTITAEWVRDHLDEIAAKFGKHVVVKKVVGEK